ncbi:hypothetical protein NEMBOFW57_006237 [Staphylotrichum longicolle]|uniref:non-specific serine/threonine protein kinase n=1 Tax=Staphylotrichum longicolle TaxID=669026 RepID=A0AAD4I131_9PEZI|nr:hypothetical protein NEMBOFW57_006237 [Staphylotrichum longicolle]
MTGEKIAIKLESVKEKHPQLKYEAKVYKSLAGGVGIPFVRWYGIEDEYNAMVLDLLGPSLEDLFNFCNRKFTLKTVLLLADQLLSRIEYIHSKSFIHRDIKPDNLVMGRGKHGNQVHIIDFGLAKNYRDPKTHFHIPYKERKILTGTARYCSTNTHLGVEQSRRDDMVSLGYVLLYFLRGSLPWQGIKAARKKQRYDRIKDKKMTTPTDVLCSGVPDELAMYLEYSLSLRFDDKPDYEYLRRIFRDLFVREGFQRDYVFDWNVYKYQKMMEKIIQAPRNTADQVNDPNTKPPNTQHGQTVASRDIGRNGGDTELSVPKRWTDALGRETRIHGTPETADADKGVHPTRTKVRLAVSPASPAAGPKDRKTPEDPIKRNGSRSRSGSPSKRSKAPSKARSAATSAVQENRAEFDRGAYRRGTPRNPDDDTAAPRPRPYEKFNVATQQHQRQSSGSFPEESRQNHPPPPTRASAPPKPTANGPEELIKQFKSAALSQEQLVDEVKGMYRALIPIEAKCIQMHNEISQSGGRLDNDLWKALLDLHRKLLHEYHDFFLGSQHPSASPALQRLAAKYAMPARIWRHGIHSFLELLRHRLPASMEHMLMYVYAAYSMIALLYETAPAFEETWIECLGDLGRYRMAMEDNDIRDREVWNAVSRHWYSRACDKGPTIGRFYHHLAILSRPNALQELYFYSKSLCVEMPFPPARESIMTLIEHCRAGSTNPQQAKLSLTELHFVRTHDILFAGGHQEFDSTLETFLKPLDNHIGRSTRRWLESGYYMAISNICAVTGYGSEKNPITKALKTAARLHPQNNDDTPMQDADSEASASPDSKTTPDPKQLPNALRLFAGTYDVVCRRFGDSNILPFLHVSLVFLHYLTFCPEAMAHVAQHIPWKLTASMLNTLIGSVPSAWQDALKAQQGLATLFEDGALFPGSAGGCDGNEQSCVDGKKEGDDKKDGEGKEPTPRKRPLPDDFALRGLSWTEKYFPSDWFVLEESIDDDEKYFELASMMEERRRRVVWLGCRIAEREGGSWLRFDRETKTFGVNPVYEVGQSVDCGELDDDATVIA